MKRIKFLIIICTLLTLGCESFLEKQPLDIISDNVLWEDKALVNSYLADLYFRTDFIEKRNNHQDVSFAMIASMGGEGRSYGAHHPGYYVSTSPITSAGVDAELDYWDNTPWTQPRTKGTSTAYRLIRDCNYFIENMQENMNFDPSFIDQTISEVRFLRAYVYFQLVIRYGGVPLITHTQSLTATPEELNVSRNSEKEVYDFIIAEMNDLIQDLPSVYEVKDKGRPTKWAAYAFQSRAALYAASIAKYGQIQLAGLLGFPASDVEYYAQISYDASKSIISNGLNSLYEKYLDPTVNYQNLFLDESTDNKEVIMASVYDYSKNRAHGYTLRSMPHDFSGTWGAFYYLYDFIERFEFADGTPGNKFSKAQLEAQEWTPAELFDNRDPRFKASVFYPESQWQGGKVLFHVATIRDGVTYKTGSSEDGWPYQASNRNTTKTGFMVRKRCNEKMILPTDVYNDDTDYIIYRMGEIYLNLTESAYYLNHTGEALDALNRLRQRAGMPPKTEITEAIIQNERLVELCWENQSYWDIRRWRIAKQLLDGVRMRGLQFTYNYDTKEYKILVINAEGVARTFQDWYYYLPLGIDRIADNPSLVENPGY
jgi:hypothetical protein